MRTFSTHIEQKLKDECFRKMYEEERQMAESAVRLALARDKPGKSQKDLVGYESHGQSNGDAN